jgi:hypothetical protein
MLHQHGRKAAWGCSKPQPWRPWTAMEIHSYQGSLRPALEFHSHGGRKQLWNPRAGTNGQWRRVYPPLPCGQANPVRPRYLRAFRTIPV